MEQTLLPRRTLIDSLVRIMEDSILTEEVRRGTRLPSEVELAAQYQVSRPVVRETLARLRERGLVETVNGSGTFVRASTTDQVTQALVRYVRGDATGARIPALYEVRALVEVEAARVATLRAQPAAIAEIAAQLEAMRYAKDEEAWSEADLAFHLAIADATSNPYFRMLLMPMATAILTGMHRSLRQPASREAGLMAHSEILEALRSGDADRSADSMRRHLVDSEQRYGIVESEDV